MRFGDKLKKYREENNITQADFAKEIGVSLKTLSLYENGQRYPRDIETYKKLSDIINCDYNYLLESEDEFLAEVSNKYGNSEVLKAKAMADTLGSMFAGGSISDSDKDAVFQALTEAYWKSKDMNKKYGRKKK